MKITKGSLVAKINKVVSGEGSASLPVVFKQGDKKLEFESIGIVDDEVVLSIVPAKKETVTKKVTKEEPKDDTAHKAEKGSEEESPKGDK